MRLWSKILAMSLAGALAGCAAVSGEVGGRGDDGIGPVYYLPTTRIPLVAEINFDRDEILITGRAAQFVGDTAHRYRLGALYSATHSDIYTVTLNENGLLTSVKVQSEGRLDEAILQAAKGVAAGLGAEGAEGAKGVVTVATFSIDAAALASSERVVNGETALEDLNITLNNAIRGALETTRLRGLEMKPFLTRALEMSPDTRIVDISVRRMFKTHGGPTEPVDPARERAVCERTLCYRLPVTYVVEADFFDGAIAEARFSVPNGSATFAAEINRGVFSKWTTDIALFNGMMTDYKFKNDQSEALAAATLPADAVGAFADGLLTRANLFKNQTELEKRRLALLRQKEDLAAERRGEDRSHTFKRRSGGFEEEPVENTTSIPAADDDFDEFSDTGSKPAKPTVSTDNLFVFRAGPPGGFVADAIDK